MNIIPSSNAPNEKNFNLKSDQLPPTPNQKARGRSDSGRPPPIPHGGPHPRPSSQAPHPRKATGSYPHLPHDATMIACISMSLEGKDECLERWAGNANINYRKTLKGQHSPQ